MISWGDGSLMQESAEKGGEVCCSHSDLLSMNTRKASAGVVDVVLNVEVWSARDHRVRALSMCSCTHQGGQQDLIQALCGHADCVHGIDTHHGPGVCDFGRARSCQVGPCLRAGMLL